VQSERDQKAPISIRIFGYLLIAGGVAFVAKILIFGGQFTAIWSVWTFISKGAVAVSGYGFLQMKRWAVYLYFSIFTVDTIVFYLFPPSQEAFDKYTEPLSLGMFVIVPTGIGLLVAGYWRRFS
jgi:hypothetical protein